MISLKNSTSGQSIIGKVVMINPRDRESFIYAPNGSTRVAGIVTESVPVGKPCKIAVPGDKALVMVQGNPVVGSIIRLGKTTDVVSLGVCMIAKQSDAPYLYIGKALTASRGMATVVLDLMYTYESSSGLIDWFNVSNYSSRIVTDSTTEVVQDYTIICNKATAMSVTLLAASGGNRVLQISNIGAGVVTITPNGTDTIDGETSQAINQWETIEIKNYYNGLWKII